MAAIHLFCDVAQQRSMSRAAQLHGVTQSAASQRIQALERELRVQLVDRSKRPLELTAAGDLFYRGCRRILDQYDRLQRQVTQLGTDAGGTELRGEVTVAAIYSAGIDLLNQVKAEFEAEHPQATVRIAYLQPHAVYERVRHGRCDLGILSYPQRWRDLCSLPLRDETMVVAMRAGHPLGTLQALHAAQLEDQELVSFDRSLPIGRRIQRYLRDHAPEARVVHQFDNIDTIKTFIAETDALAILPDRTVRREVASDVLAAVDLQPTLVRSIGIVHPRQREQSALVRRFIEYLIHNQPSPGRVRGAEPLPA